MEPPGWLGRRVRGLAGLEPVSWRHVTGRGYTPSERWVVTFDDGTTGFAKGGTEANSDVAEWLRIEAEIYRHVSGAFLPRLLGWADEGGNEAVLLLEDLSHAVWPPPWTPFESMACWPPWTRSTRPRRRPRSDRSRTTGTA